jgi:uncharacterized secreted protein with C-terminal beta-propeller domain
MMKSLHFPGFLAASLVLAALITLAACHRGDNAADTAETPPFSAKLVKALDPGDLEKRLKAQLISIYERQYDRDLYWISLYPDGMVPPATPLAGSNPDSATVAGASADTSHSETNVQEKGVDEGDLVKTDGTFLYIARGSHFFVLQPTPAEQTSIVSDIDLNAPISELHLSGTTVAVIMYPLLYSTSGSGGTVGVTTVGTNPPGTFAPAVISGAPKAAASLPVKTSYREVTKVYLYDVTNPASPVLSATFEFPGSLEGSRRINSIIYLVINHSIDRPNPVYLQSYLTTTGTFQDSYLNGKKQALAENISRINALTLDDLLSTYTATIYSGGAGTVVTSPTVSSGDVYIPEFGNGTDLSLIVSLDLSGPAPAVSTSAVLSSWCRIYMNQDSLYLSSDNNWMWIEPMAGADMPQGNPEPRTAVHKFSVGGATGKPQYRGSGVVDGWLNNRFSMSDYQGYLRIGTTRGGWWREGTSNQLAVLADENGSLVSKGTLTGIAPGESIYSMRFDRDRGYMVTFHRTDPLFTIDLSDPAKPRVAGEIQVNGFATYIHLLGADNTKLLTIGQSADASGRATGNKLQLFDVSDLATPRLLSDYELGAGWSDALYDPHAFLYYEPLGLLAIPYSTSFSSLTSQGSYSTGLNIFNIDPTGGISKRGIISAATVSSAYGSYYDIVDRSVVIGSNIYALSLRYVTAAGADLLDVKKVVALPPSYSYGPINGIVPPGIVVPIAASPK